MYIDDTKFIISFFDVIQKAPTQRNSSAADTGRVLCKRERKAVYEGQTQVSLSRHCPAAQPEPAVNQQWAVIVQVNQVCAVMLMTVDDNSFVDITWLLCGSNSAVG